MIWCCWKASRTAAGRKSKLSAKKFRTHRCLSSRWRWWATSRGQILDWKMSQAAGRLARCPDAGLCKEKTDMKLIRTEDAAGQVLCHDITQIIPGEFKGARFRKGHVIQPEDIPVLLSIGKENLYVWEKTSRHPPRGRSRRAAVQGRCGQEYPRHRAEGGQDRAHRRLRRPAEDQPRSPAGREPHCPR